MKGSLVSYTGKQATVCYQMQIESFPIIIQKDSVRAAAR